MDLLALPDSERAPLEGARELGPAEPGGRVEVTVVVRPRPPSPARPSPSAGELGGRPLAGRRHLSREELEALRGADPADLDVVAAFARGHGLELTEVDGGRRAVSLAGTAAAVGEAFGVGLARFEHPDGSYRGHSGPVRLPADMVAVTVAVLGLDDRPQARSHLRPAVGPSKSYTPVELGGLYGLPGGAGQTAGEGETIGIIELGGGYRADDLTTYFHGLGLAVPALTAVPVDGGANSPTGSSGGPDAEVVLDIEVAGALAPGAAIVVYFAPNTDRGFLDAVSTALHDRARSPSVVSISWGGPESSWTASAMRAFDQTLSDAALVGVTVTVAAGDGGSSDGVADGLAHVDFPASSPHALACGGTRLTVSGGAIEAEVVWNDGPGQGATGGGVSDVFGLPAWQQGAGVPPSANPGHRVGRGVPDVAGDADPATGYRVRVDGADIVVGGTSAVAPLWAGLVALLNQSLGHSVGYLNPLLYSSLGAGGGCRDIIAGGNGAYSAGPGWDACTGWGSPDGPRLESGLGAAGGG